MGFLSDPRFLRRLRIYGFGFLMGLLLVIFFFNDRFPGDADAEKVRKEFRQDSLVINGSVQKKLDSMGISYAELKDSLAKGEFLLPSRKSSKTDTFQIRTSGPLSLKARLKVLDEERTELRELLLQP